MALAFLRYEDSDGNQCRFSMDLGKNRYYSFAVGDGETFDSSGVQLLKNRTFTSRVLGPIDDINGGRTEIRVPSHVFDRRNRAIQLLSYRTRDRVGPAVSRVIQVPPDFNSSTDLPALNFSLSLTENPLMPAVAERPHRIQARVRTAQPVSQTMFLEGLVSLLPSLLPVAGNVIGALMGGATSSSPSGAATPITPGSNSLLQMIQQLLSAVGTGAPSLVGSAVPVAAPVAAPATPTVPTAASLSTRYSQSETQYSQAMIVPALMAALPALMPLLQSVLSPQTIQSVLQTADPNRLIGTVSNAIQGIAQLGLQANQQQMQHLERLNPGVNDPAFDSLLQSMSLNLSEHGQTLGYRRVDSVKLHFADLHPVKLAGREVVPFLRGHDFEFPIAVETSRPIPNATYKVVIKKTSTLEVIAEGKVKVPPFAGGRIPISNPIPAEQLNQLEVGEDYLVTAHLVWRNRSGDRIGASMTQGITVVADYHFDSLEDSGKLIPLDDVEKYRDFWHKVWQGTFDRDLNRVSFECKYYYVLDPGRTKNGQVETTIVETDHGLHRSSSRLKSALFLSPNRLNDLIPRISNREALSESELTALLSPDFIKRVRYAARTNASFNGRPGQTAALWIFPEVKMLKVTLVKADNVASTGHVLRFEPHEVYFPVPALTHFVGVAAE